jgi:long-subunit acyl-CoA synthetase (AMP-forming)
MHFVIFVLKPKGAIITHLNIISNEAAINERLNKPHLNFTGTNPPPVHMSYLPLGKIFI